MSMLLPNHQSFIEKTFVGGPNYRKIIVHSIVDTYKNSFISIYAVNPHNGEYNDYEYCTVYNYIHMAVREQKAEWQGYNYAEYDTKGVISALSTANNICDIEYYLFDLIKQINALPVN